MQETKPRYRVVNEKLRIVIGGSTYIEEVIEDLPSIPRYKFSLVSFDEIQEWAGDVSTLLGKKHILWNCKKIWLRFTLIHILEHADVIGMIVHVSTREERMRNGRSIYIQLVAIKGSRYYSPLNFWINCKIFLLI